MNFWEFKEDYSQGYYLPASNKAAFNHGRQLTLAVFSFVAFIFKLVLSLLAAVWLFIFTIFRLILRLTK